MRTPSPVLAAIAALLFIATATSARAEFPRIRALDASLAALLAAGYARSQTFRSLVDRLEQSDVVVHVDVWPPRANPGWIGGALRFVTTAGGVRYLRIRLVTWLPDDAAIALLGHELQHAVEVADDPGVVNDATFEALYRRIGEECHRASATRSYDTAAARETQHRIAAEVRKSSPRTIAAR